MMRPQYTRLWPLVLLSVAGALLYCVLGRAFADAFYLEPRHAPTMTPFGGPSAIFGTVGGVLGWASVMLVAREVSTAGPVLWLLAAPWWLLAALGGFACLVWLADGDSTRVLPIAGLCLVASLLASAATVWLDDA